MKVIEDYKIIKFKTNTVKITKVIRRNEEVQEYVVILLENKKNKRIVIHPLTSFIYDNWRRKEHNTQLARAKHIVAFLNHIFFDYYDILMVDNLEELHIKHAIHFLEKKVSDGCVKSTIYAYDSTIMHFYYYLTKKKLLKNYQIEDFKWSYDTARKKKNLESMLIPEMEYVPTNRNVGEQKAKTLEQEHVPIFIMTAIDVAPRIALGIYLSIFGGLRGSEVMSVKRSTIKSIGVRGEHGLIVKLATDRLNSKGSGNRVKSPGIQPIQAIKSLLSELYISHDLNYPAPIDGSDSLFVNKHGKTMQYQTYNELFNKVKESFIQTLKKSPNPDDKIAALNYKSLKWSTHIGRGTYSNSIAEQVNSILEIMRLRRDRSPNSSTGYLTNTKNSIKILNDSMEELLEGK
ncbi:glycogen branching protein [Bacillaceae bacterium IKA-2]|nr:glycogen branching protein [Bacillaceae bacterium IKA-2]